jgi:signal transduction histidine kinase
MTIAVPVVELGQVTGVLIGEVNLIAMWDLVDSIRIGQEGYAFVVSETGQLLAHGRGAQKPKVLQQADLSSLAIVQAVRQGRSDTVVYSTGTEGEAPVEMIGVSAPIAGLGWGLVIEQPTREAYAQARAMTVELASLIGLFLLLVVGVGSLGGRRYIVEPIQQLMQATRRVAAGNLTETVKILTHDEFQALGEAFNEMTGQLVDLQERIRRDERAVVFGKIAAGLAHDLRHPILNIENNSRLLLRRFDEEARDRFVKIVARELAEVKRFLDDLRDLTRPTPLTMVALDLRHELAELVETFEEEAGRQGVKILCHIEGDGAAPVPVWADKFAIGRVLKNLIRNALDAMAAGGTLALKVKPGGQGGGEGQDIVLVVVTDTGHGIPPERLAALFTDYFTTKRKGLGLGLAVTKKIVEELGGTISVSSVVGQGSTFTVLLKAAEKTIGSPQATRTSSSLQ